MMEDRGRTLDNVIQRVGDLPALPAIVSEVLRITDDPSVALSKICDQIQRDPALTAKILKVSNSPYYGMRQYVGTLKLALVILGAREIRNITLGIAVFETLRDERLGTMLMEMFWRHSVLVAALSKKLGSACALGLQGEDFIAGLLHDIGKMILLRHLGGGYERLLADSLENPGRFCEREAKAAGFDHTDAAAALVRAWNLPMALGDALWCHHARQGRPLASAKDAKLAAVVRIANSAVHDDFEIPGVPCESCADEEAWQTLDSPLVPADVEGRRQLLEGMLAEIKDAPELMF